MTYSKFLQRVHLAEHLRTHYRPQTLNVYRVLLKSITVFGRLFADPIATGLLFKNARMLFKEKKAWNRPVRIDRFLREQKGITEHIQKACEGQLVSDCPKAFSITGYGS